MNKFFSFSMLTLFVLLSCTTTPNKTNVVTDEWTPLFNGRDLDDWTVKIQHHDVGVNFGKTFRVEEGIIKVRYDQYGDFNDQFAHLYFIVNN